MIDFNKEAEDGWMNNYKYDATTNPGGISLTRGRGRGGKKRTATTNTTGVGGSSVARSRRKKEYGSPKKQLTNISNGKLHGFVPSSLPKEIVITKTSSEDNDDDTIGTCTKLDKTKAGDIKKLGKKEVQDLPAFRKQKESAHTLNFDDSPDKQSKQGQDESEDLPIMGAYRKKHNTRGGLKNDTKCNDNDSTIGLVGDDSARHTSRRKGGRHSSTTMKKGNTRSGQEESGSVSSCSRFSAVDDDQPKKKNVVDGVEKKDDMEATESMEVDDVEDNKGATSAADGDKNTITITKDAAAEMKGALDTAAVDALKGGEEEEEREAPAKKKQRSNSTDEVVLSVAKADDEVVVTKSSVSSQKEKEADQKGDGKETVHQENDTAKAAAAPKDNAAAAKDDSAAPNPTTSNTNGGATKQPPPSSTNNKQQPQSNNSTLPINDRNNSISGGSPQLFPPSNNWIEQMTSQITATATSQFNSQRQYYESKLREHQQSKSIDEIYKRKYEEQVKENERLRTELYNERELNLENEIKISNLMQEVDMLKASRT